MSPLRAWTPAAVAPPLRRPSPPVALHVTLQVRVPAPVLDASAAGKASLQYAAAPDAGAPPECMQTPMPKRLGWCRRWERSHFGWLNVVGYKNHGGPIIGSCIIIHAWFSQQNMVAYFQYNMHGVNRPRCAICTHY